MNFLLNHEPSLLTFDVDIWIQDEQSNRARLNSALQDLNAEWGATDAAWKPIGSDAKWLESRAVFCLTSAQGAIDVFREVRGLEGQFDICKHRAKSKTTASGIPYYSLADEDMLRCQEALEFPATSMRTEFEYCAIAFPKRAASRE